jgi:hypothetical protein
MYGEQSILQHTFSVIDAHGQMEDSPLNLDDEEGIFRDQFRFLQLGLSMDRLASKKRLLHGGYCEEAELLRQEALQMYHLSAGPGPAQQFAEVLIQSNLTHTSDPQAARIQHFFTQPDLHQRQLNELKPLFNKPLVAIKNRAIPMGALLSTPLPVYAPPPHLIDSEGRAYDSNDLFPSVERRTMSATGKVLRRHACPICNAVYGSVDGANSCLLRHLGLSYACALCLRSVTLERNAIACTMEHYTKAHKQDASVKIPEVPIRMALPRVTEEDDDQVLDPLRRHLDARLDAARALERLDQLHHFPVTVTSMDPPTDSDASLSFEITKMLTPLPGLEDSVDDAIPFDPELLNLN